MNRSSILLKICLITLIEIVATALIGLANGYLSRITSQVLCGVIAGLDFTIANVWARHVINEHDPLIGHQNTLSITQMTIGMSLVLVSRLVNGTFLGLKTDSLLVGIFAGWLFGIYMSFIILPESIKHSLWKKYQFVALGLVCLFYFATLRLLSHLDMFPFIISCVSTRLYYAFILPNSIKSTRKLNLTILYLSVLNLLIFPLFVHFV